MNDSKNMILAVVLSALVLLGWSWAANRFFPTSAPPPAKSESVQQAPATTPTATAPVATKAVQNRATVLRSTPRVRIQTPSLEGSINLKGAQIDDLELVRQRTSIARDSQPVRLLSPLGAPGAYIAAFGWTGEGAQVPGKHTFH